jgi:hypothetical protein
MKSKLFSLSANEYVQAAYKAFLGAVLGYALPILSGAGVFNMQSAKLAILGALTLGLHKGIGLYLTNSNGDILKKEDIPAESTPKIAQSNNL